MIQTFSAFYYGHSIDSSNYYLNFKEGVGPELTAQLNVGEYSLTDFCTEVSRAMNSAGALTYSVTVDRSTRLITVSTSSAFTLLAGTGTNISAGVFSLLGFSADTASATSHLATSASGFSWEPQFKAQDFVDFEDQQSAIDGVVKKATNGTVEAVKFGNQKIMDANFLFITDIAQSNDCVLKSDSSGVDNARSFLEYATTKADLEFVPDIENPDTFFKCLLESTVESSTGTGFKLKEMYAKGLPGYFETGILKFRLIE